MREFFRTGEAMRFAGVSYRQIQYWDKTGFVRTKYRTDKGHRLFTFMEVAELKLATTLRKHGFSVQCMRHIIFTVRELVRKTACRLETMNILFIGTSDKPTIICCPGYCPTVDSAMKFFVFSFGALHKRIRSELSAPAADYTEEQVQELPKAA